MKRVSRGQILAKEEAMIVRVLSMTTRIAISLEKPTSNLISDRYFVGMGVEPYVLGRWTPGLS